METITTPDQAEAAALDFSDALYGAGEYAAAIEWLGAARQAIAAQFGPRQTPALFSNLLCKAYRALGLFERALEHALIAEETARQGTDRRTHAITQGNLGAALADIGEVERAADSFRLALKTLEDLGDEPRARMLQANLAILEGRAGRDDIAEKVLTEVAEWARVNDRPSVRGSALESLGESYRRQGRLEAAVEAYREVLVVLAEQPKAVTAVSASLHLAETLLELGRAQEALDEIVPLRRRLDTGDPRAGDWALVEARAHEQLGQWKEACEAYREQTASRTDAARGRGAALFHQSRLEEQRNKVETLERELAQRTERLSRAQEKMIGVLATMAEARDGITGAHIARTSRFVAVLAEELSRSGRSSLGREEVRLISLTSVLHDIGKVSIPDAILSKPGPLTPEEMQTMRQHVTIGEQLIASVSWDDNEDYARCLRAVVSSHHERWDGLGYPRGLKGDEIPLAGRIMAVADVYDALRSPRPYKQSMEHAKAKAIIEEGAGTHFDPAVIGAFLATAGTLDQIYQELTD